MRAAVVAALVLGLVVALLVFVAVSQPVSAQSEPRLALERSSPAPVNPFRPSARDQDPCPQPGVGAPDLTGCPDGASRIGFGDLRRAEALGGP